MAEIRCPLREAAGISGKEPAVIHGDAVLTYDEFDAVVSATAGRLGEAGIERGDRLALFLTDPVETMILAMACMRAGVVACPLNTWLPAEGLRRQIDDIEARHLVARVSGPGVQTLSNIRLLHPDRIVSPVLTEGMRYPDVHFDLEQPAVILFTSGGGGRPKPAQLGVGNLYYSSRASNIRLPLRSRDRWLLNLPLYHVSGLGIVFRCLLAGATAVVPDPGLEPLRVIERRRVTHVSLVATQLSAWMAESGAREILRRMKIVLVGGMAVPDRLLRAAVEWKIPVCATYGMTEMSSQVTTVSPTDPPAKRLTAGACVNGNEVRIVDGEIHVRGRALFQGYVEKDGLRRPTDDEGWFATRDTGRIEDEGYLTVTGRRDRMFISGGENIQPQEIEQAMNELDGVREAVVVSIADEEFGRRPLAFVATESGAVDSGGLRHRLRERLPSYKIPVEILPMPEVAGGGLKADRAALQRLAERGRPGS